MNEQDRIDALERQIRMQQQRADMQQQRADMQQQQGNELKQQIHALERQVQGQAQLCREFFTLLIMAMQTSGPLRNDLLDKCDTLLRAACPPTPIKVSDTDERSAWAAMMAALDRIRASTASNVIPFPPPQPGT